MTIIAYGDMPLFSDSKKILHLADTPVVSYSTKIFMKKGIAVAQTGLESSDDQKKLLMRLIMDYVIHVLSQKTPRAKAAKARLDKTIDKIKKQYSPVLTGNITEDSTKLFNNKRQDTAGALALLAEDNQLAIVRVRINGIPYTAVYCSKRNCLLDKNKVVGFGSGEVLFNAGIAHGLLTAEEAVTRVIALEPFCGGTLNKITAEEIPYFDVTFT